jgi:hypothetical protein
MPTVARALTVELGGENSLARYWRVAPAGSPGEFVTVREGRAGSLVCLTDYTKGRTCQHTEAVRAAMESSTTATAAA